ncbi:hypothetical protein WI44_11180 [Burkholderia cepacia]|uniref:hypothetical protein n=1 Tax=Burkholderia cepacia TaxID=292 RepID=UPI000759606A|nr:hypothetical protein [Burkholderia cepacia]KVA30685.1 hypothetical protein WI45_35625 [Burkholderia cepacia]KVA36928.1 hypothetical protein WI44_11180 [Burkholderia cepacia]
MTSSKHRRSLLRDPLAVRTESRFKEGAGARHAIDTIGTWCGVEVQRFEGLPDAAPFNFDRI